MGDIISLQLNDSGEIEEIFLISSKEAEDTDESSEEETDVLINENSSTEAATEQDAAEEVE